MNEFNECQHMTDLVHWSFLIWPV